MVIFSFCNRIFYHKFTLSTIICHAQPHSSLGAVSLSAIEIYTSSCQERVFTGELGLIACCGREREMYCFSAFFVQDDVLWGRKTPGNVNSVKRLDGASTCDLLICMWQLETVFVLIDLLLESYNLSTRVSDLFRRDLAYGNLQDLASWYQFTHWESSTSDGDWLAYVVLAFTFQPGEGVAGSLKLWSVSAHDQCSGPAVINRHWTMRSTIVDAAFSGPILLESCLWWRYQRGNTVFLLSPIIVTPDWLGHVVLRRFFLPPSNRHRPLRPMALETCICTLEYMWHGILIDLDRRMW